MESSLKPISSGLDNMAKKIDEFKNRILKYPLENFELSASCNLAVTRLNEAKLALKDARHYIIKMDLAILEEAMPAATQKMGEANANV